MIERLTRYYMIQWISICRFRTGICYLLADELNKVLVDHARSSEDDGAVRRHRA